LKTNLPALCAPLFLLLSFSATADTISKIKAARDLQLCQIDLQQQRDVKDRPLLNQSYDHYRSIHKKTYALLANVVRIMERDLSRNLGSLIAYASIPDFVLEKMDPKPGFYNLAQSMISIRNETREFLVVLGLDPSDPVLQNPMITRADLYSLAQNKKLRKAPIGSPEGNLGIPIFLSPSLHIADSLLKDLSKVIIPTEEGISIHPDTLSSNPEETLKMVESAKAKLLGELNKMDQKLETWATWTNSEPEDCAQERAQLEEAIHQG
jgi:hypothetical protein